MRTRAAVGVVGRVTEAGDASGLAADDSTAGIGGACELRGAVRVEVDRAVGDAATLVIVDAQRDVEAVDKRN